MRFKFHISTTFFALFLVCSHSVIATVLSSTTTDLKLIRCQDEYTVKHKLADSGISLFLEKNEETNEYVATLTKLGFVATTLTKVSTRPEFLEKDKMIVFSGRDLKFSLSLGHIGQPKGGMLHAIISGAEKNSDSTNPSRIDLKMICSAPGKR